MRDGVEIRGLAELQALLKSAPKQVALPAGRKGVTMASARMRTYLRRAAPKGATGKLKAAIRSKVMRKSALAFAGIKKIPGEAKARNYYATLEKGRKGYTRKSSGTKVKGSPQMARFAFFHRTVDAHKTEVLQLQVDATRAEFMKRLATALTRAAIKGRR